MRARQCLCLRAMFSLRSCSNSVDMDCKSHITRHTSHVTRHTSHVTRRSCAGRNAYHIAHVCACTLTKLHVDVPALATHMNRSIPERDGECKDNDDAVAEDANNDDEKEEEEESTRATCICSICNWNCRIMSTCKS
jgi:hypothetical protein